MSPRQTRTMQPAVPLPPTLSSRSSPQFLCTLVIVFFLLLLAAPTPAAAQPALQVAEATLRSVTFIDADQGWCAGDFGVILHSDDSGLSWRAQESTTTANLAAIGMFNSRHGLAVGGSYEPHTQIGRGVVVLTGDGGESWKEAAPAGLPPLRHLILGPRGHCVAGGDWSPVHGTNLFASFDGGATWEPIENTGPGAVTHLAGAVDDCLVLSDLGDLTRIRPDTPAQPLIAPGYGWTALAGHGDLRWLSGPRATLVSTDRGTTWHATATAPAADRSAATDPEPKPAAGWPATAACVLNREVWSIDAAGTTIATHAATVLPQPPGRTSETALRAVCRLDAQRGWAVGDWGTILVTRDAGRSWRSVRGGDCRAAIMAVAKQGHQLPWPLLAIESQQHLRRVAVVTGAGDAAADQSRLRDALRLVGPAVQHRWDGTAGGAAALLTSPPAVLVLDQGLTADEKLQWTTAAIDRGVRRVFETGRPNGQTIHYAAALPGSGKLAGDLWTEVLWRLRPGVLPPDQLQLAARFDNVGDHLAADGLASWVGTDRRFVRQTETGTSRRHLQVLQARSGESAWVESLVSSPAPLGQRIEQFEAALPRVAEENRQRLLYRILVAAKQRGKQDLYQAMLRQAAQRWPEEPLGRLGGLYADAITGSEEWQQILRTEALSLQRHVGAQDVASRSVQLSPFQSASAEAPGGAAAEPSGIAQASFQTELAGGVQHASAQHDSAQPGPEQPGPAQPGPAQPGPEQPVFASTQSGRSTASSGGDLLWNAHPAVLMAKGLPLPSSPHRLGHANASTADAWARLDPSRPSDRALRAPLASQRPLLDGRLTETIWSASQSFALSSGESAALHVAHDPDFLYLAVQGPTLREQGAAAGQRRRDMPLNQCDRYVIRIDVDGDLLTGYELEFDAVGNTRDTCDGFVNWQPRWFIAVGEDSGKMIAEIAIAKPDLMQSLRPAGQRSYISLERRGGGEHPPALALSKPEPWRLLVLE